MEHGVGNNSDTVSSSQGACNLARRTDVIQAAIGVMSATKGKDWCDGMKHQELWHSCLVSAALKWGWIGGAILELPMFIHVQWMHE